MFDPKTQIDHNYSKTRSSEDDGFLQFRPNNNNTQESDDSGVCSPPLWKNSPSPNPSPSHPLISHYCLSPNSRTKAIARGQRELMEMVKNMPESSYELSLKDLVEHHHKIAGPQVQNIGKNQILQKRAVFVKVKRQESKKNGSFEEKGLFLKMGFLPFNLGSKKMKRFGDSNIGSGKVISTERDWWKKKFTGSSDSYSSGISSNSGGGSSSGWSYGGAGSSVRSSGDSQRKKHGVLTGCWPFSQSRSNKSIE
ncbi:hypothetical protein CASFOL_012537 [Castilleja foliolosa]|uniref:Uncharacterized protein n=1 Tax=Castilleja foliolosa TaxID=1961234 RepID=A0ABD3DJ61_9LAMI